MHYPCYTGFALSDLAVSGDLPFRRQLSLAQISPKPLQRIPMSLLSGDLFRTQ